MSKYPNASDYPAPPGNKPISLADIVGPASYVEVVPAGPLITGGQVVNASAFGLSSIESIIGSMGSDDGQYDVVAYLYPYSDGRPATAIRLMWRTSDGGVEVAAATNLSGRKVRIAVVGLP